MARDYAKEYANYQSRPAQRKRRAGRNAARRQAIKDGKVKKGDGIDVSHDDGNPLNNKRSNLSYIPKSKNRSYPRTRTARKKRV